MIKLEKLDPPALLVKNGELWKTTLLARIAANEKPTGTVKTRYRHAMIKAVLVRETNGKCAYCESKLQHIHHGDVEHIVPKSLDPALTFEWSNLTLACEVCNQNKSDLDPKTENIIDPYATNPEDHLFFLGGLVFARADSARGVATRIILKLHRPELVEMRNRQLDGIMKIYHQIQNGSLPLSVRKAIYSDFVDTETSPSAPYSAMTKCVVKEMEKYVDPAILE
ncbi:HNH endonuclease [Agrobacterium larrymoorei]|uniref:Uncharacterized protein (TIGR02646 family) n=1 Tax=Agrobacterium larrymoorei TaxID=160699 RepID=A0ABU0UFA5_9HYPH|nr:HNH endonuclease [Agrobacterium larrymoorei]MDQ1183599.1 uncharacterized protein (TIGR02646 family) [Agrobacterium larrymoorei]